MVNTRVIRGNRGLNSKVLVHDGFMYHLNNSRNNAMYWRCWIKDCRSSLRTNVFQVNNNAPAIQILNDAGRHNHVREDRSIEESDAVNRMKDEIIDNPTVPIKRVYNDQVVRAHQNAGDAGAPPPSIPDFHQIRSSLARTKTLQCPPIPANINQVNIVGPFAQTYLHERYLLHLDNAVGVALFATDVELNFMANCQTLYVDGTFRTAPAPYAQVFTIHGEVYRRIILLAMALLSGKTQQHYDVVFATPVREMRRVRGNNPINVGNVISDFEIAVFNSVRNVFPRAQLHGCYFHFNHSLWRYIQDVGLAGPYGNDALLQGCISYCFALGFVPLVNVVNSFTALVNDATTQQLIQQYPNLQRFFTYLWNTYLVGNNFPLDMWNVFNRGMSERTNNCVESYHARWNQSVGVRHPSLWILIRKLQDQQAMSRNSLIRANNGYPPIPRKAKWRRLENRINNLKMSLLNGQRNVLQYWSAVRYVIADFR